MESKSVKSVAVKKEKRVKDPEAPKRSKSSYLWFCSEERDKIKKEKPTLSAKEITAELGTKWQSLKSSSPDLLKKYESLASDDKSRYASEKAVYSVKSSVPASAQVVAQSVDESAPVVVKKASRSKKGSVAVEAPVVAPEVVVPVVVPPPVVHEEVPAVVPVAVDAEVVDAKQSRRKKKV